MRTIHKYTIAITDGWQEIELPMAARVVHFDYQPNAPLNVLRFWAEVDTAYADVARKFCIVGTGHPIPDNATYVASCIQGPLVWHLYERIA